MCSKCMSGPYDTAGSCGSRPTSTIRPCWLRFANRHPHLEFNVMKVIVAFIVWVLCVSVEIAPRGVIAAQPAVLHKNDGELRMRRPREGVSSPSTEFLLKIGPKTNGSKHLLVFSEEMPPGAAIPRHRHHGEEEIILIQSGTAHVWLGDQEYDAESG